MTEQTPKKKCNNCPYIKKIYVFDKKKLREQAKKDRQEVTDILLKNGQIKALSCLKKWVKQ